MKDRPRYTIEVIGSYAVTVLAPLAELLSLGYRKDSDGKIVNEELNDYDMGEIPKSLCCIYDQLWDEMSDKKWLVDDVEEWEAAMNRAASLAELIREKIEKAKSK